jgi:hypothetical protein
MHNAQYVVIGRTPFRLTPHAALQKITMKSLAPYLLASLDLSNESMVPLDLACSHHAPWNADEKFPQCRNKLGSAHG